jgi:hypothetical protein
MLQNPNSIDPTTKPIIINVLGILAVDTAPDFEPGTGRKCFASSFCCSADCLNATKPTISPAAKKMRAMMSQSTPQTAWYESIAIISKSTNQGNIYGQTLGWATPANMSECRCIGGVHFARNGVVCRSRVRWIDLKIMR